MSGSCWVINTDESRLSTIEQIEQLLVASAEAAFTAHGGDVERYDHAISDFALHLDAVLGFFEFGVRGGRALFWRRPDGTAPRSFMSHPPVTGTSSRM